MFDLTNRKPSYFLTLIAGIVAIFAFAPFNFIPAFIISICILLAQVDRCTSFKFSMKHGFIWGLGFFIAGLHWFAFALMVDFKNYFWLIPFSLTIVQAIASLYIVIFATLSKISFKNSNLRIYFLACSWTILEWIRGNLFTGFPWIISGYCFTKYDAISQLASITGIYGLSFIIMLMSLSIYELFKHKNKSAFIHLCIVFILILGLSFFGYQRIKSQDFEKKPMPKVLLVQSGILAHKPSRDEGIKTFFTNLNLTKAHYNNEDIIIWSESAHPFLINKENDNFRDLFSFINSKAKVVLGTPSVTIQESGKPKYWNSMIIVNQQGKIESSYDKMHLVPFGEFIPLQQYLPPINIITENLGSYSAHEKMTNIKINNHYIRPLICYEAIFSDHPEDKTSAADFIINITNDNWYGDSIGPYQHFSMTKYRAIEQGIPLIRVAISGISAIFDSYGRIVSQIGLSKDGLVSAILPYPLKSKPIYSAEFEYAIILIMALLSLIIFFINSKKTTVDKAVGNS